jgi:hypothetical protein|tara:strand:+ start:3193 stop:3381 length:189 start_codon:yes stop_codon:yes gene_type:complete
MKIHDISTNWLINKIVTENGINNVLVLRDHLYDLLIAADTVVIIKSDIGIEALYYDTPVIVY